jgi:hypothetical protein
MKLISKNLINYEIVLTLLVSCFLSSCDQLPWKKEIKPIELVKGLYLGGDYDVETNKTHICDPRCKPCGYELINKGPSGVIMSYPSLYSGTYEGKRILAQIKLNLHDPYNYPIIGNDITPAISDYDVNLVKDKLKESYGYNPNSESENTITWIYKDDVMVRMNINKNNLSYLEGINGVNPLISEYRNSYSVSIEYFFVPDLNDQISFDPMGNDVSQHGAYTNHVKGSITSKQTTSNSEIIGKAEPTTGHAEKKEYLSIPYLPENWFLKYTSGGIKQFGNNYEYTDENGEVKIREKGTDLWKTLDSNKADIFRKLVYELDGPKTTEPKDFVDKWMSSLCIEKSTKPLEKK